MTKPAAPGDGATSDPHATVHNQHDPVVESALASLDPEAWVITRTPAFTTATRSWPDGWVDTLYVLDAAKTQGQRDNPLNRVVWQRFGAIGEIAAELDVLPAPGQPGAPTMPVPGRDEDLP